MSRRIRLVTGGLVVALLLAGATTSSAQGVEERLRALEAEVADLRERNEELEATVEELREGGGELSEDSISQIEQMLSDRGSLSRLWNRLHEQDDGFVRRIVYSGESRTRVDFRSNTADLLDELDDEGVRLDYRFNFGIGFNLAPEGVDEDSVPVNVKTWIEFQAAGRGANNTAEDIQSGIGVSIGDFATRENDLDIVRLYQAYVLLEDILGTDGLELKVGRQELVYGSQLVLGSNEFFTGTVHDAVRLDFRVDAVAGEFSVFYAKEAASDGQVPPGLSTGGLLTGQFRSSGDEDELLGLYSEFTPEWLDPVKLDVYYVYFNARSAGSFVAPSNVTSPSDPALDAFGRNTLEGQIHTVGLWLRGEDFLLDGLFLSLEVSYQLGHDEARNDLDALVIEFAAEYDLPFLDDYRGKIFFSYYFAEGPDSGLSSGYSPLFISRHNNDPIRNHGAYSRFGNIDLIPTQNIHVIQGGFKFEPWDDWILGITYLYSFFNHSAEPLTVNAIGNVYVDSRSFGHEIDVWAKYQLSLQTDLFFNLSVFIPDADFIIEAADGSGFADFDTEVAVSVFAQIQVRF